MAKKAKASSLRKPGTNPNKVKPSETVPTKKTGRFKNTKPKAKPKANPKANPKGNIIRDAMGKGWSNKMLRGRAGAVITGLGVIGGMAASYFSGKSDKSQVGDISKSKPSSAWSSNQVQPKVANNSKGEKSKTGASTVVLPRTKSKGTGNNATKPPSVEASSVRKPDGAIPTHSQAKPNTPTAPKVVSSGGRGTMGNTPKKVAAIRAGRLVNATTPAKTEAAKQSISLGQMALNNADDKNTYGKRTYPDNVAINRNPDMGGAKSSKKSGFTPRSKPTPPSRSRKTSVDTESYSGASRPNPGFEFNDKVAPKPLNKAGGTKNTPDGFSQFMANLTGVDVTPDNDKGKKKFATAKNKTGGALFGMFK